MTEESGNKIPRPSSTVHRSNPNEVLHFDLLYLGKGEDGMTIFILRKDDLSSYCWLITCHVAVKERMEMSYQGGYVSLHN